VKIGDLITYVDSSGHADLPRELGTIIRDDHAENDNYCYIVWHTADNQGWWDKRCLRVVSKNETR
jgi:hypothetical protein